MQKQNFS